MKLDCLLHFLHKHNINYVIEVKNSKSKDIFVRFAIDDFPGCSLTLNDFLSPIGFVEQNEYKKLYCFVVNDVLVFCDTVHIFD